MRDVFFSTQDENGEERLYSVKDLSHKVAKKFRKLTGRETIKDKAENVVESAKKGIKTAGKWAAKEANGAGKLAKDLAVKGVDAAKAHPVKTALGATTAVAVPVASVAGYKYYKKHKKACK